MSRKVSAINKKRVLAIILSVYNPIGYYNPLKFN